MNVAAKNIDIINNDYFILMAGKPYWKGRLSTVDLLIIAACCVKSKKYFQCENELIQNR